MRLNPRGQSISARPTSTHQLYVLWTSTLFCDTSGGIWAACAFTTSRHAAATVATALACGLHPASDFASALHAQHELLKERGPHRKLRPSAGDVTGAPREPAQTGPAAIPQMSRLRGLWARDCFPANRQTVGDPRAPLSLCWFQPGHPHV